ncbi:MAG: Hpt domain-containing protein [Bacteroidales bacterium]|jgi:HPt (histidine-containing phosphotransfer) domain-containing protein|nr:Hpt domain-containing protein [Bacteroidales bacterium]
MIDRATFTGMYENFDKEVVVEIIDIFINEYNDRIATLQANITDNNTDSLYKNAHSIKGVIANFYDDEARDLAYKLEQKGKNGDMSGITEIFVNFKTASRNLLNELTELKESYL